MLENILERSFARYIGDKMVLVLMRPMGSFEGVGISIIFTSIQVGVTT